MGRRQPAFCLLFGRAKRAARERPPQSRFPSPQMESLLAGQRFDRIPFVVVNHKVYACQQGVNRHVREKKRNQTVSLFFISIFQFSLVPPPDMCVCSFLQGVDHAYRKNGAGKLLQESRKLNYPAPVHLREIIKIPEYKVNTNNSENYGSYKINLIELTSR